MTNPTWNGACPLLSTAPLAPCSAASIQNEPTHLSALNAGADRREQNGFTDGHAAPAPAGNDAEVTPS